MSKFNLRVKMEIITKVRPVLRTKYMVDGADMVVSEISKETFEFIKGNEQDETRIVLYDNAQNISSCRVLKSKDGECFVSKTMSVTCEGDRYRVEERLYGVDETVVETLRQDMIKVGDQA